MKHLLRFSIVGVSNTLLDFFVYVGLTRFSEFWRAHYLFANVIAFSCAVTWSFFWNKHWTFRDRSSAYRRQYGRFVLVSIVALGFSQTILGVGVQFFALPDLAAKALAVVVGLSWSFLVHRFWTFAF